MSIILPYKDLSEDRKIKYISPKGEFICSNQFHEQIAKSYLIGGDGYLGKLMNGADDSFFTNLSLEQCQKLRDWINEHQKNESFMYMWSDFMVSELKFDRTNTTPSDMYTSSRWPTTSCKIPFERFYNYYLMDEKIDYWGLGILEADENNNAILALEYLLEMNFITASEFRKNQDLYEEIKTLKRSFPNTEDRIKFFK